MKPFFSIIIPLYNKEVYIADTIKSVLYQSYNAFEIVVINDGSTDNSLRVIQSFSDQRIKIFSKSNGGVSSARNYGVKNAKYNYIAFLDADDYWKPNYLEEMKKLIEKFPNCGFYLSGYNTIDKNNIILNNTNTIPEGIIENYFKFELSHQITRLSATIVHKSIFKQVGGFPIGMISGEDSYFCALIALNYSVAFSPEILVQYNKKFSGKPLRYDKVDFCKESWCELYKNDNFFRNELIADKAIKTAIRYVLGFHPQKSSEIEKLTKYTKLSKKKWRHLYLLNRLPYISICLYKKIKPVFNAFKAYIKKAKYFLQKK